MYYVVQYEILAEFSGKVYFSTFTKLHKWRWLTNGKGDNTKFGNKGNDPYTGTNQTQGYP